MSDPKLTLKIENLVAFYGETGALHGVSLDVREGEIVCLLGRNGAGKTSILRSIMGIQVRREGSIKINGVESAKLSSDACAKLGAAYCPEERGIYSSLTTKENLLLPPILKPGGLSVAEIYELFPNLKARENSIGTKLSGGEQQMLAMGRILRTGSKFLLLDECTEGLAPVIVKRIGETIRGLRERGFTVLMVEQNFRFASKLADRFYVIEEGHVVDEFTRQEIEADPARVETLLGI
jgi:branched-chain amino acid transport system ATP-binding protein